MPRRLEGPGIGARVGGVAACLTGGYMAIDAISQVASKFYGVGILPHSLDALQGLGANNLPPLAYGITTGATFAVGGCLFFVGSMLNSG